MLNFNQLPQRASMAQATRGLGSAIQQIRQRQEQRRQQEDADRKKQAVHNIYKSSMTAEGTLDNKKMFQGLMQGGFPDIAMQFQYAAAKTNKENQLAKKAEKESSIKELQRRQERVKVGQDLLRNSYDQKTYTKYLDFMEKDNPEFVKGLRPIGYHPGVINELRKKNLDLMEEMEYESKDRAAKQDIDKNKALENYKKSYQMAKTQKDKLNIALEYLGTTNPGIFTQRMISKDKKSMGAEIGEAFAGALHALDAKKNIEDVHNIKKDIAKDKILMIQRLDKVKALMKNTWGRLQEQYEEGETLGLKGGGPVVGKIKKLLASDMLQIPGFEATGEFNGQRFETALALSGIMTGQNRIIEGVLNKILTTLPEQGERASYASRKIEQSVRNMFGLHKAMTRTGIMDAINAGEYDSEMVMETFGGQKYGVSKELGRPESQLNQQISMLNPEAETLDEEEEREVRKILIGIFGFVPREQSQPFKKDKKGKKTEAVDEWTEDDEKKLIEAERIEAERRRREGGQ